MTLTEMQHSTVFVSKGFSMTSPKVECVAACSALRMLLTLRRQVSKVA